MFFLSSVRLNSTHGPVAEWSKALPCCHFSRD